MMNLRKLNKYEIGKILIPVKIGKLNYKSELEKLYEKLYFNNLNYYMITNIFALSVIATFLGYFPIFEALKPFIGEYLSGGNFIRFLTIFGLWFSLNMSIYYFLLLMYLFYHDSRHKKNEAEIEKVLPEFIDNLVSNIKGGISLEKALLQSVRKEQTALLREVTLINEKIIMGKDVGTTLREFRGRFESAIINRTFFLIEEGLKGGGNLAAPLERISENLKRIYSLDEEIKGNSAGFSVVISSITIVIAPLLFSLALTLLNFIKDLIILLQDAKTDFFSLAPVPDEYLNYLKVFSYAMIVLITLFSSLIVAQLKNEKAYTAIKYLPIYVTVSIVLYILASNLLLNFFGNIIG